jgi:chemotaxis protein histidine kinase CheA
MNQQMGLTEFFAMEAGEYLERLDTLVSAAVGPDRDELMRLARALRGSALMANQQPIGGVAAALESLARAVKEERVEWDEATRQTAIRAVDRLKILVRSVGSWGDAESAKAKQIAEELAAASGMPAPAPAVPLADSVDTGTRAFVAREGATVASMLNQTAKALQREGQSTSQFATLIRSMEPLRGLAALANLSPLPEYLDGVERVVAAAKHGVDQPNELALFLDVTARGLSKAVHEISTTGSAEHDSMEAREFTRRLAQILDVDAAVVPIQSLYYEDHGPHVIEQGTPPSVSGQMGQMELVSHGEHLCQVADALNSAQWNTQREIHTLSLKSTLRTLTAAQGSSLAAAVSAFATVATDALAGGFLEQHGSSFISQLVDAGHTLGSATQGNEQALCAKLTEITETLRTLQQGTAAAPVESLDSAGGPLSRPPAPSAAMPVSPELPEIVAEPQTPEILEPSTEFVGDGRNDIAASWASFETMLDQFGDHESSIEELLAETDAELISITELCYSGSAALEQAHNVREKIRSELAESAWDAAVVTDLIDELLDLVELGVGQT